MEEVAGKKVVAITVSTMDQTQENDDGDGGTVSAMDEGTENKVPPASVTEVVVVSKETTETAMDDVIVANPKTTEAAMDGIIVVNPKTTVAPMDNVTVVKPKTTVPAVKDIIVVNPKTTTVPVMKDMIIVNPKTTIPASVEKTDKNIGSKVTIEIVGPPEDEVNPTLLETIVTMGMGKRLAKKALICTQNKSVDAALEWIAELGAEEMEVLCENSDEDSEASDEWEDCDDEEEDIYYKMVFVVNMELNMGVGKVASQVGHAALGLYRLLMEDKEKYEASTEEWEEFGERKITLRGKGSKELVELQKKAEGLHLPTYLVQDAGKTQIPAGSTTVLAIFGDEEAVNEVTGKLKLL